MSPSIFHIRSSKLIHALFGSSTDCFINFSDYCVRLFRCQFLLCLLWHWQPLPWWSWDGQPCHQQYAARGSSSGVSTHRNLPRLLKRKENMKILGPNPWLHVLDRGWGRHHHIQRDQHVWERHHQEHHSSCCARHQVSETCSPWWWCPLDKSKCCTCM